MKSPVSSFVIRGSEIITFLQITVIIEAGSGWTKAFSGLLLFDPSVKMKKNCRSTLCDRHIRDSLYTVIYSLFHHNSTVVPFIWNDLQYIQYNDVAL